MFQYVALTDGTTTIDLTDGISYALVSYAPIIAPLKDSDLGSAGAYQEVHDTLTFHAMGCTAAEAYAAAAAVNKLLDQARHWWDGDPVSPVILKIQAQDSALDPLQVVVRGRALGAPPNIALQPTWNATHGKYVIPNITVQFVRDGQLLSAATESAASANATYPTIHTATFSSAAETLSPIEISIGGFTAADLFNFQSGYCLIAPTARLFVEEGEAMTSSSSGTGTATATTVADAAKKASAGNVRRWTGTTAFTGTVRGVSGLLTISRSTALVAVFAVVRINNSTITGYWQIEGISNAGTVSLGPQVPVEYASNQPQIVNLGYVASRGGLDQLSLAFTGTLPITTTLDIDYIVAIQMTDEASAVLGLTDMVPTRLAALPAITPLALEIRSNALIDPTPAVAYRDAANNITEFAGYAGNPYLLTIGSDVGFILLSVGSGTTGVGNAWRPATPAAAAAISSIVTVTRRLAYLVPS